jgi:AraC family transcriptional regulator
MESIKPFSSGLKAVWNGITVEYAQLPPGEKSSDYSSPVISVVLTPQRSTWRTNGTRETVDIAPGSLCLYSHSQIRWRWQKPAETLDITLAPDLLTQAASECSLPANVELRQRLVFTDPTILQIAALLKAEVENTGLGGKLYTESLANVLAVHLLRNYRDSNIQPILQTGGLDERKLNQIKDFIEAHLAEELTLARMAAVVPMSQFHFARVFKTSTSQSPYRYVIQRRIERAKSLFSITRLSVAEVAHRVGFSNKSHFITQFRKATGYTPQRYRDSL